MYGKISQWKVWQFLKWPFGALVLIIILWLISCHFNSIDPIAAAFDWVRNNIFRN